MPNTKSSHIITSMQEITILISGISSKNMNNMAGTVAQAIERTLHLHLCNKAFVGENEKKQEIQIGNTNIELIKPQHIANILETSKPNVIVDYAPGSENWKIYIKYERKK